MYETMDNALLMVWAIKGDPGARDELRRRDPEGAARLFGPPRPQVEPVEDYKSKQYKD